MKSLMSFLQYVLKDLGTWCHTSTTRDFKTISRRVEDEGLSFLTITLANFGKDFQKSLDQGYVGSDQFVGFQRSGGLPLFLEGFLCRVFDPKTGRLVNEPDITCIWAIRQLTLMWAKINLPCTKARERKAIESYIDTERCVRDSDSALPDNVLMDFHRVSMLLWADILSVVDKAIYDGDMIPAHGPGATADHLAGNSKWSQSEYTERLDKIFPVGDYLLPSWRHYQSLSAFHSLSPEEERPVKVILVPKTQKTPRVIAMEPTCMMFMQQGIAALISKAVSQNDTARQLISTLDQIPNQEMAREGSLYGNLATLDLSEASDRVSNQHVRALLARFPWTFQAVDACRSRKADVRGVGVIRLAKFASMGSALTFPIEAMVFTTIVFLGIEKELKRPLTKKDVQSFLGRVRVYGDDIIVPVDFVEKVTETLETFGLKVNSDKSFWTGKFRESCGKDFYFGEDISITKVREVFPTHRSDVPEIISTSSLRNQLYKAGLWESARFLDELLSKLIPYPTVGEESPAIGRHSFLGYETQRSCPNTHRPLVKAMVVKATLPKNSLDGIAALLKVFSIHGEMPIADEEHLKRSGRPRAVDIKPGWFQPF